MGEREEHFSSHGEEVLRRPEKCEEQGEMCSRVNSKCKGPGVEMSLCA